MTSDPVQTVRASQRIPVAKNKPVAALTENGRKKTAPINNPGSKLCHAIPAIRAPIKLPWLPVHKLLHDLPNASDHIHRTGHTDNACGRGKFQRTQKSLSRLIRRFGFNACRRDFPGNLRRLGRPLRIGLNNRNGKAEGCKIFRI